MLFGDYDFKRRENRSVRRVEQLILNGIEVHGTDIDYQTRCKHYSSKLDIIAIKFYCCNSYYSCIECHEELSNHAAVVWPRENFTEKAILCGACGSELTIEEYVNCDSKCPSCRASFNPGCKSHYHLYFQFE